MKKSLKEPLFRLPPGPMETLAFGELEPLARALLAVLLALVLARISSQEAKLLEPGPQFRVELHQGPRNTQTDRARLAGDTAAIGKNHDIELLHGLGRQQRLPDHGAQALGREIIVERAPVHLDLALTGP